MSKKVRLPVYGVGPIYGAVIIIITILGILLIETGGLRGGDAVTLRIPFRVLGILLFGVGILLLVKANLQFPKDYVKEPKLITTGVYAWVRNPCYTAVTMGCMGALLWVHNLWLLLLPVYYWGFLTILMKCTEERWLTKCYGQEYLTYCKRVNRCIPWFPSR